MTHIHPRQFLKKRFFWRGLKRYDLIRINPYAPEEELIGQASRVLKKAE
jgi:hypothetical protein